MSDRKRLRNGVRSKFVRESFIVSPSFDGSDALCLFTGGCWD